jgi:serine/threonine-protein kinase
MAGNPQVLGLLEEMLDSGKTPDEVCRDCPDLLPEVRQRWQAFHLIDEQVAELLPGLRTVPGAGAVAPAPPTAGLPQVPGYKVEAVLGRGGMGLVYKARHLRLGRTVALKMLLAGAYAGPHERARFQREAEAVASLRHANIVQVYDVGDHEGRPYFTMEFVEGGSLAHKLAGTPQPARQAAALALTLAEAVHVAHRGGIVHRDLKPANVLLTADDTPKISDFGLARRLEGEAGPTQSGVLIGTPSYMAPEQAEGRARVIGPATDVYALGAILYESLTGRPPFRAETAGETVLQVIHQEPASPSRLNAKVPRDLETICLKCLRKEPESRYASAAALADDLRRFGEGRPIQARPLGWAGRFWRWCRRKPAAAALVAMALALVGLTLGSLLWLEAQQAERRAEIARQEGRTWQAVETALEQAAALQAQDRWQEAKAVLAAAPSLEGTDAPASLLERARQARVDTEMAVDLEEIRLALSEGWRKDKTRAPADAPSYPTAFQSYGINLSMQEPAEAAALIRKSAIRDTLVAYLHDWFYLSSNEERGKLGALLNQADEDPWRRAYREALASKDIGTLKRLAGAPEAPDQPPVLLSGLGGTLLADNLTEEALALLREAQRRHPDDFWINLLLGHFLERDYPHEAVGYFRAAVAIRPRSDQAHTFLGRALRGMGDPNTAAAALHKAIALNPSPAAVRDLAKLLAPAGRLEEARVIWEKLLKDDPPHHESWHGYAQLCLFLGNEKAYRRVRAALLDHFGDRPVDWIVAERTAVACLLLPLSGDQLRRAAALADRAVADAERKSPSENVYVRFAQGLADYRQDRLDKAVPLLQYAAGKLGDRAGPQLVLAMAQFRSGATREARKTLATALRTYNWKASGDEVLWVSHVLRREAQALILPDVPPFLRGGNQPREDDERLALVRICKSKGLYHTAARLFTDSFAGDPLLADELTADCLKRAAQSAQPADRNEILNMECRYLAARCAALFGCGFGNDGTEFGDAERMQWRRQALEWLRADLTFWAKAAESQPETARAVARSMLTLWQSHPDLAGLREPAELKKLSADERKDCLRLWADVSAVLGRPELSQ